MLYRLRGAQERKKAMLTPTLDKETFRNVLRLDRVALFMTNHLPAITTDSDPTKKSLST